MKFKLIFVLLFVFVFKFCFSQILLPKGFRCVSMSSETNMRDSYFSDGTFRFHSEAWGRESQDPSDMIKIITKNYENKIRFKKTQDNLYWGTGVYRGEYKYIVIVPSSLTSIALSSKVNGTQFSNYSSWILQQVRININIEKGFDFTDWKGKACL